MPHAKLSGVYVAKSQESCFLFHHGFKACKVVSQGRETITSRKREIFRILRSILHVKSLWLPLGPGTWVMEISPWALMRSVSAEFAGKPGLTLSLISLIPNLLLFLSLA